MAHDIKHPDPSWASMHAGRPGVSLAGAVLTSGRYLIGEILRPFGFILGILVCLFASYCAAGILADAVNSLLPTNTLLSSVGLKALISLEVLIPIALLISVVLAFGRLNSDSEITAMFALGITPGRVLGSVLTVSASLALVVAALSLFGRPWAYQRLHDISEQSAATLNVDAMQPGTFYADQSGQRVIYFRRRAGASAPVQDVFVRLRYPDHIEIIHGAVAAKLPGAAGDALRVGLRDAHMYKIGDDGATNADEIVDARMLISDPENAAPARGRYGIAGTPSAILFLSPKPADVAEWQWRLSTPVSTLLLGMLGLPLGRVRPRQNRYAKFGTAILIYAVYYLLCLSARTWVAQGVVAPFPGLWWAPALLGLSVTMALWPPQFRFRLPRGRHRKPAEIWPAEARPAEAVLEP